MKTIELQNWLKQTIKYGHPLVWDICFALLQKQKGELTMLDVILENIPALVIITILGYIITFYFIKIDKMKKQYGKEKLIQKCNDKTRDIYINLMLRFIRNLSNEDEKKYKFSLGTNITKEELKYIGYSEITNENDDKKRLIQSSRMNNTTIDTLNKDFSDAELESLGFTKDEINEYN